MSPWLDALRTETLYGNGETRFDTDWRVHEEPRDFTRFYWVTGGAGSITHGARTHQLRPGFAYLVPPGRSMRSSVQRRVSLRWVHIRLSTLGGAALSAMVDLPARVRIADRGAYDAEWTRYLALVVRARADEAAATDGRLRVLLAPFLAKARPCVAPDRVGVAMAWAEARCEEPPSVDALAAVAGMHPTSFAKAFRRRTGLPPATWLRQHRLSHARGLIGAGATLAEAAARCGFCDAFHLSRLLKASGRQPRLRAVR